MILELIWLLCTPFCTNFAPFLQLHILQIFLHLRPREESVSMYCTRFDLEIARGESFKNAGLNFWFLKLKKTPINHLSEKFRTKKQKQVNYYYFLKNLHIRQNVGISLPFLGVYSPLTKGTITYNCNQNKKSTS